MLPLTLNIGEALIVSPYFLLNPARLTAGGASDPIMPPLLILVFLTLV